MAKSTKKYIAAGGLAAVAVAGYVLTREKVEALDPVNIMLSNPIAEPQIVFPGHVVTISIEATNIGETRGSHTIILSIPIDGLDIEQSKTVVLDPTETKDVVFTISAPGAGAYVAYMNGEQASFMVEPSGEPPQYVYICPECGEEFVTQGELDMHMVLAHGEPYSPDIGPIYIPGNLVCARTWEVRPFMKATPEYIDYEIKVTNVSEIGQVFTAEVGQMSWGSAYVSYTTPQWVAFRTYDNLFLSPGESIILETGSFPYKTNFKLPYLCRLSGPISSLAAISGTWSLVELIWHQAAGGTLAYTGLKFSIQNLTGEWQSIKIKYTPPAYGGGMYATPVDEAFALAPHENKSIGQTSGKVYLNDELWLSPSHDDTGSIIDVVEYDIWY